MGFFKKLSSTNKDLSLIVDHVEGIKSFDPEESVNITWKSDEGILSFKSITSKKKPEAELNLSKVEYVELATEQEIKEKDKSVIGRAAVGTLIAGPLGSIIGGISGVGKKKKKGKERKIAVIGYDGRELVFISGMASFGIENFFKKLKEEVNKNNATDGKIQL